MKFEIAKITNDHVLITGLNEVEAPFLNLLHQIGERSKLLDICDLAANDATVLHGLGLKYLIDEFVGAHRSLRKRH